MNGFIKTHSTYPDSKQEELTSAPTTIFPLAGRQADCYSGSSRDPGVSLPLDDHNEHW